MNSIGIGIQTYILFKSLSSILSYALKDGCREYQAILIMLVKKVRPSLYTVTNRHNS